MRLLIVTQAVDRNDPILGFFHQWISQFAAHCESVHVICLRKGEADLPRNVFVHSLGKEEGAGRVTRVLRFLKYVRLYRREYDAVFVHMNPEYVVLAGALWRMWGKRTALWYVHKSVTLYLKVAEKFLNKIFTAARTSIALASPKIRVMGHGIDTDAFTFSYTPIGSAIDLRTIGRLSRSKGILEMLAACDELYRRKVSFKLAVIGGPVTSDDESYKIEVDRERAVRPYRDDVSLPGSVANAEVPQALAGANMFLNLSETGGLDKAMLESMALGVPVLTSNHTVRDILEADGLYLESRQAVVVADGIEAFARKPESDRRHIAESLREEVVKNHSLQALIPAMLREIAA